MTLQTAQRIIKQFEESSDRRERKSSLNSKISVLEAEFDDYKLFRGFSILLERRCKYVRDSREYPGKGDVVQHYRSDMNMTPDLEPFVIRRKLFELSSRKGFGLTDVSRNEIINEIAYEMKISPRDLVYSMWSDLEENMLLHQFDRLSPEQLISWYNLSLLQTLVFNCTKLEFSVKGGLNWKRVLRAVKRLGLMYTLDRRPPSKANPVSSSTHGKCSGNQLHLDNDDSLVCSIDGPLSVFKLTDKYGTSIARLIPLIISTKYWLLKAWIIRKTLSHGKKIYEFEISKETAPELMGDLVSDSIDDQKVLSRRMPLRSPYFDSDVERKFANRFEQSTTSWKLIREPDPLILPNGKAFISDFAFERHDRRVYLEIVGFWTREYLCRKMEKLTAITTSSTAYDHHKIDLFVAVNEEFYTSALSNTSEKRAWEKVLSTLSNDRLIVYKNSSVPVRPILDYLRSVDEEMIGKFVTDGYNRLVTELDKAAEDRRRIISIDRVAQECNIPNESALRIIKSKHLASKHHNIWVRDYVIIDRYLIPKSKFEELRSLLANEAKFSEACSLLRDNNIPESCYIDLISKIGFEIIWNGIDYNSATLKKLN